MTACNCSPHADLTCDEARTARRDPSGTLDLRRAFIRALEKRWRRLARLATDALVKDDLFGLGGPSARALSTIGMQGGRVPAFQSWLDAALADTMLGIDREQWIGNFVSAAYARGWARTARQVDRLDLHVLADRADILVKLAVTELQGVIEVVSQQAVRAFADGMLAHAPAHEVARLVRARINSIGVVRSRALAQFMCVRAVADATLDVCTLAGRTHVGLVPETLPSPGRSNPVRDAGWVESEHPRAPNGEFGESEIAFHGTTSDKLKSILKKGLIVGGRKNAAHYIEGVYLARDQKIALSYARSGASHRRGDMPVVLKVRVPKSQFGTFKQDMEHRAGEAIMRKRNIPPNWIVGHKTFSKDADAEEEYEIIYVAFILRDGVVTDARRRKRKRLKPPLAEIVTAGDDDVCEECQDLEDDNPYTIAQARGLIPAHPHCRCAWAPL
jgi:hypothetical protein